MSDEELKKAQFFFDFVAKTDLMTQQSNERVTKKIHGVLTLASTLIPVVFGLEYFILSQTAQKVTVIPIFLSLLLFFVSFRLFLGKAIILKNRFYPYE